MYISPIDSQEYVEKFKTLKNSDAYKRTQLLIQKGKQVKNIVKKREFPCGNDLQIVKQFIVDIESWKYGMEIRGCKPFYKRHLASNNASSITNAVTDVCSSVQQNKSDADVLKHLNYLKGMGSINENTDMSKISQKMASAVLRLLYPEKYGVVDWRIAAVLTNSKGSNSKLRDNFKTINASDASEMFELYRIISKQVLNDTGEKISPGDIESVLFDFSFQLYPINYS
ncbi:hypothetical protein KIH87_14375 [Paraneptunicella aestuarii]|uniref:hypothetical protein n=1 Tax=Paraneptunicella aestuarii TaxID=2831148 RepID=UPI001E5A55B8|nr:hypothetical protein [Paraneptunicella aestuarii]UAA37871.1 hypothetical protein KIH87_14375 [Paraneptunicella aestuarii]